VSEPRQEQEETRSGDAGFAGGSAYNDASALRRGSGGVGSTEPPNNVDETPVEDELATVTRERDEYLDALQRLKAEFDNYRKRVARDQQELAARAHERLIREVLPVLDDLELALAHEGDLDEGIRLIHRRLSDALAREGLAEVPTDGKFDPHTQEALLSQPSDQPEGNVIEVFQKGYKLGDRVLRPARVVVSQGADG
jgi:molecular chaperone GrpE